MVTAVLARRARREPAEAVLWIARDNPVAADRLRATVMDAARLSGIRIDPNARTPSMSVTVAEFEADEVVRAETKLRFAVAVNDAATGRQWYQREIFQDPVQLLSVGGMFADPKDPAAMAQTTLNRAIDETLDSPGFMAAIRSRQSRAL